MTAVRRLLVLALLLLWTGSAFSQFQKVDPKDSRNNPVILHAFTPVVAHASEATVRVLADGKEVAFGTVVEPDGWIVTKWSEIQGKKQISVKLKDGKTYDAKVVGVKDEDKIIKEKDKEPKVERGAYDIALLKVDAKGLKTIEWRNSKEAKVGRWVASVGHGDIPVAIGVVSVGTRLWKIGDQPPKNTVNAGWLGVGLESAPGGGAKITLVDPKGPAQAAKFKVNDVVYEAAGRKIQDHEALINTVQRLKPKDVVVFRVKRGEEDLELKATLGTLPKQMLGNPQEKMGSELSNRRGGFPVILQHDTVLKPKDCGGPLVDLDGKTVGINIARAGRTETYAIPSEDIQKLLPELKSGKLAPKDEVAKIETVPQDETQVLRVTATLTAKDAVSKLGKGRTMKVHTVKLQKDQNYTIDMESTEIDSYLIIEDAKGNKLAEDDDGGGFPNARIQFTAPSDGEYRILATTFNEGETGNYTLTVRMRTDSKKKDAPKKDAPKKDAPKNDGPKTGSPN